MVDKLRSEAKELAIPTVYIPTKTEIKKDPSLISVRRMSEYEFSRANSIRVSTYEAELKSGLPPADVLIIDDADMFVQNLQNQTKITISKQYYPELYDELLSEINPNNYTDLNSILSGTSPPFTYQF